MRKKYRDRDQSMRDKVDAQIGLCIDKRDFEGVFNQELYLDDSMEQLLKFALFLLEKRKRKLKGIEIVRRFHELEFYGVDQGQSPNTLDSFWTINIKKEKTGKKRASLVKENNPPEPIKNQML